MDEKEIKKIIEDGYDESKEDTVGSMVKEFYKSMMILSKFQKIR